MSILSDYRQTVDRLLGQRSHLAQTVNEERLELGRAESLIQNTEEAQKIIQLVAQMMEERIHQQVAAIVSRCLETIFDEPYEFRILFEQKRGKTEARMVFLRDGEELDPLTASGGGVVDVAAFALRVSCLMLAQPRLRRVLVLDEPFRFLSEGYRGRVRELLTTLAQELDIQFVMVTHIDALQMGTVVQL